MNDAALHSRLMARLAKLGVEERPWPGRDDGASSLICRGKEVAHFHHPNELDLRLGKQTIQREKLVHPRDSNVHPKRAKGSPWIELRLVSDADVAKIARLVEIAIADL